MKNICIGIGLFFSLLGCGTDEDSLGQYNPYLINPQVNITLNLNLPQYNDLNLSINSQYQIMSDHRDAYNIAIGVISGIYLFNIFQ